LNGPQYKHTDNKGDPAKNGMGSWRAGQAKPILPGQESYAASLVSTGGFTFVTMPDPEPFTAPYAHTASDVALEDDTEIDATMEDDETTDDED